MEKMDSFHYFILLINSFLHFSLFVPFFAGDFRLFQQISALHQ